MLILWSKFSLGAKELHGSQTRDRIQRKNPMKEIYTSYLGTRRVVLVGLYVQSRTIDYCKRNWSGYGRCRLQQNRSQQG